MLKFSVLTDGVDGIAQALKDATSKAEKAVTVQAAKDTEPYVPMLTGSLTQRTRVEDNQIIYPGPYARYLWYGKVMEGPKYGPKHATDRDLVFTTDFHPQAQSHWFEASKAENLEKWVRVAQKAVKNGG
jgi:hypothetical protein